MPTVFVDDISDLMNMTESELSAFLTPVKFRTWNGIQDELVNGPVVSAKDLINNGSD